MTAVPTDIRPAEPQPEPTFSGEPTRIQVFEAYGFESLEGDPELLSIAGFAARLCNAPIALVSLLEQDRYRFLARIGTEATENPYSTSFCAHVMVRDGLLQVPDASVDPRFAENPLVLGEPYVRFYAGLPLVSEEGVPLGALCVIDTTARPDGLDELQREGLQVLAQATMRRLRSRRHSLAARRESEEREAYLRLLADSIPAIAWSADPEGNFEYFNQRMLDFTGKPNEKSGEAFHPEDWPKASTAWRHALDTGETYEVEHRFCRSDGEYRWMISRAVPVRDSNGNIVRWFGTAVDIHDIYEASASRDLLAKELSHRIKNIFAVVSGLISLSARKQPEFKGFADELVSMIHALGRAHEYVRPSEGKLRRTLHGLLSDLFSPYGSGDAARVAVSGDDSKVAARAATPLALVFHELATNSAKYGALATETGTVDLTVTDKGDTLQLCWVERGAPPRKGEMVEGFGSRLVEMSVTGQLGGKWERRFEPDGMICELTISKAAITL